MKKIDLKTRTGKIVFSFLKENNTIKDTLLEAIKNVADLSKLDLRHADLSGMSFNIVGLRGAYMEGTDLRFANLSNAFMHGVSLRDADLRYANLTNARLNGDLHAINLGGANLTYTDLRGANLISANFTDATLKGTRFFTANLRHANLKGTDLSKVHDLDNTDLRDADLRNANLRGVKMRGAILHYTLTKNADFTDVEIKEETLENNKASLEQLANVNKQHEADSGFPL